VAAVGDGLGARVEHLQEQQDVALLVERRQLIGGGVGKGELQPHVPRVLVLRQLESFFLG